jgi:dTMP kinase
VLEGGDGAGRSTQVGLLLPWLAALGYAALPVGLGRSPLTHRAFEAHRRTPEAGPRTLALLYAADLTDQARRRVTPGLQAGFLVIADRWTVTARARCLARDLSPAWLDAILPAEPRPDLICHLEVAPEVRLERQVRKRGIPEFRESGRDAGFRGAALPSFLRYQEALDPLYARCGPECAARWCAVPGDGDPAGVQDLVRHAVADLLGSPAQAAVGGGSAGG